jgi:hypothetical protein
MVLFLALAAEPIYRIANEESQVARGELDLREGDAYDSELGDCRSHPSVFSPGVERVTALSAPFFFAQVPVLFLEFAHVQRCTFPGSGKCFSVIICDGDLMRKRE